MTALGWGWALFVWGYALVCILINDWVRLPAHKILDPVKRSNAPTDVTPHIAQAAASP